MNIDIYSKVDQEDKPLTRADVEDLVREAGGSDKLKLVGLNLGGIDLAGFNLEGADLSGSYLSGATLRGAILRRAILSGTTLDRADLSGANLRKAYLSRANLREAHLSRADLSGANLREANLWEADLSRADLTGAYLRKAHLREANLSRAHLWEAHLSRANLAGANLAGANLAGADLTGADLTGADLTRADLTGADLTGADLTRAYLFRAIGLDKVNKANVATVEDTSTFRIRIVEEPLTPHNLTSIISAITDLSVKCWLIANRQLADLIEYQQTHDVRFIEESKLIITKITYNSPFDANFKIDLTASNVAEAIKTTIDGVKQANVRLEKAELENKAKAQEIEHAKQKADQENNAALLELEKQALANERERLEILEKRLEVQKKGIEYAFEIAAKTVMVLQPNANEQTKGLLIQTLLPTILQMQNGKGLELVLPIRQENEEKTVEPESE